MQVWIKLWCIESVQEKKNHLDNSATILNILKGLGLKFDSLRQTLFRLHKIVM